MTFEAGAAAFTADAETLHFKRSAPRAVLPANAMVADPEAGWARRNPDRAMLFLFVSPRDCAVVDELMAA